MRRNSEEIIESYWEVVGGPFWRPEETNSLINVMLNSANEEDAIDAAKSLWIRLEDDKRMLFCDLAWNLYLSQEISCPVWSSIVSDTYLRGRAGSLLTYYWGYYEAHDLLWDTCPQYLMNEEDYGVFRKLGRKRNKITVYRGVSGMEMDDAKDGLSWTLDEGCAHWFAGRLARLHPPSLVMKGVINKNYILAYFDEMSEKEVVCPGWEVESIEIIPFDKKLAESWKNNIGSSPIETKAA